MTTDSTRPAASSTASCTEGEHFLCDDWFDPLESGVRTRIRSFIEELDWRRQLEHVMLQQSGYQGGHNETKE